MKLLVVAHPDDETIFFGGLINHSPGSFHVVCVTDGNADGRGEERKLEFENACKSLGAKSFEMLGFPDIFEKRLDIEKLVAKLKTYNASEVYTHNPVGEYGHPHHQDVSHAVYQAFQEKVITVTAYNNYPDTTVALDKKMFDTKAKILTETYDKETSRFLNILPITHTEGFAKVKKKEADSIYNFLSGKSDTIELDAFENIRGFIENVLKNQKRLF